MPKSSKIWLADTVVLSNFAFANATSLLMARYDRKLKIPDEVYQEIKTGLNEGYTSLNQILKLIEEHHLENFSLTLKEREEYFLLSRNLGPGEAACIAAAIHRKGIVISDDRIARTVCHEKGIPHTGSIGILKACCLDKSLNLEEADHILNAMIKHGFYSPVRTIKSVFR